MDKSYAIVVPERQSRRRRSRHIAVALLVFFGYYVYQIASNTSKTQNLLSVDLLEEDYAKCAELRRVPVSPSGAREFNKRWTQRTKPVLIRNATVWTGEPAEGTSPADAKRGVGYEWINSDVLLDRGLIVKVAAGISDNDLPEGTKIYDARGHQLTAGIVDMHSHAGLGGFANLGDDTNELSGDITPYVKSLDGFNPIAPEIQWIKSGGVTTSLLLPGSGNNMGGEAFVLKLASGKWSGRDLVSQEDMFADPDKTWRYMKMACGENPKSVYGKIGRGPFSRLGEAWEFRHAFEQAREYVNKQDEWCDAAQRVGVKNMKEHLPSELKWESLGAVLRGQVRVNTHCYTIPDLEAYIRHTQEFKFRVYAFHHAHQTYLVPEVLKRAYGGTPAAALFADNMYYKVEAYTASENAGAILWDEDITPVYVSDNPVMNSQHVVFEAAKAYGYGLPYHVALAGVTSAPAELLGFGERLGKVKAGFDADIVVWDSDPLSVGATPRQVWIDGAPQFAGPVELKKNDTGPIKPKPSLAKQRTPEEAIHAVFTGVTANHLTHDSIATLSSPVSVVVLNRTISCIGSCTSELAAAHASGIPTIALENGYLAPAFTAFGSSLGLLEIDAERNTQDGGYNADSFPRAVDGLTLGGKHLSTAWQHGVIKAISAPSRGSIESKGISVGFFTEPQSPEDGTVFQEEVGVHYPLTLKAKDPSISAVIGKLRIKLLQALSKPPKKDDKKEEELYSEESYLRRVVSGDMPLVLSVHSADTIASIIRMKHEVEKFSTKEVEPSKKPKKATLNVVILGGAESHLVAKDLSAANISVVLAPLLPFSQSWDQRRSLSGAPLTNGTAIDALVNAGVLIAIGVDEIWETRNLGLMAGWAYKNGEGRLSEKEAYGLVSSNIDKILGIKPGKAVSEFSIWEGNPLEIGGRLRGLGSKGRTHVWT